MEPLGPRRLLAFEDFPVADPSLLVDDTVTASSRSKGKVRDRLEVPSDITGDALRARPGQPEGAGGDLGRDSHRDRPSSQTGQHRPRLNLLGGTRHGTAGPRIDGGVHLVDAALNGMPRAFPSLLSSPVGHECQRQAGSLVSNPPPRWGAPGDDLVVGETAVGKRGLEAHPRGSHVGSSNMSTAPVIHLRHPAPSCRSSAPGSACPPSLVSGSMSRTSTTAPPPQHSWPSRTPWSARPRPQQRAPRQGLELACQQRLYGNSPPRSPPSSARGRTTRSSSPATRPTRSTSGPRAAARHHRHRLRDRAPRDAASVAGAKHGPPAGPGLRCGCRGAARTGLKETAHLRGPRLVVLNGASMSPAVLAARSPRPYRPPCRIAGSPSTPPARPHAPLDLAAPRRRLDRLFRPEALRALWRWCPSLVVATGSTRRRPTSGGCHHCRHDHRARRWQTGPARHEAGSPMSSAPLRWPPPAPPCVSTAGS